MKMTIQLLWALVNLCLQEPGEYDLDPKDAGPQSVEHTAWCGEFIGKEHTPVIRVYTVCQGCQEVVLTQWW